MARKRTYYTYEYIGGEGRESRAGRECWGVSYDVTKSLLLYMIIIITIQRGGVLYSHPHKSPAGRGGLHDEEENQRTSSNG